MPFKSIEVQLLVHDLMTPLCVIDSAARCLLEQEAQYGTLTDSQKRLLGRILRNARRSRHMVSHALEVAQAEAGVLRLAAFPVPILLTDVLTEAVDNQALEIGDRLRSCSSLEEKVQELSAVGVQLRIHPQLTGFLWIQDETKVRQVLMNLVLNSLRHRKRTIDVTADVDPEKRILTLKVRDDGPGIDPRHHAAIFEKFFRLEHAEKGYGVGLSGAKSLVCAMGGELWVESDGCRGSVFVVRLPRKEKPDTPEATGG